jgi:hypothetical protein
VECFLKWKKCVDCHDLMSSETTCTVRQHLNLDFRVFTLKANLKVLMLNPQINSICRNLPGKHVNFPRCTCSFAETQLLHPLPHRACCSRELTDRYSLRWRSIRHGMYLWYFFKLNLKVCIKTSYPKMIAKRCHLDAKFWRCYVEKNGDYYDLERMRILSCLMHVNVLFTSTFPQ